MHGYNQCFQQSHFGSSFRHHAFQFGIDKGEASERCLVDGVDEVLVSVGEAWLLVQELPVKVAAVVWAFLNFMEEGDGLLAC